MTQIVSYLLYLLYNYFLDLRAFFFNFERFNLLKFQNPASFDLQLINDKDFRAKSTW